MPPSKQKSPMTVSEMAAMGGKARAARMTPAERTAQARHAARARWAAFRREKMKAQREKKT